MPVHTIPVPKGWSPEQAWEALKRGDKLPDNGRYWANVLIVDGHYIRLFAPQEGD